MSTYYMLFARIGMVCRVFGGGNGGQIAKAQIHTLCSETIAISIVSALFRLLLAVCYTRLVVLFGLTLRKAWLRLGVLHWLHMHVKF